MKTYNTEVALGLGESEMIYSVKSPKTGKVLDLPAKYVPQGMAARIEIAVQACSDSFTGTGTLRVTVADLRAWKAQYDRYVLDVFYNSPKDEEPDFEARGEREANCEPYEVRFGPKLDY